MLKAFDQFIQDYHSNSGNEEDVEVVKKWAALKKVILNDPRNIEALCIHSSKNFRYRSEKPAGHKQIPKRYRKINNHGIKQKRIN